MSRLRVRTPSGAWLDICESEWYVRDSKNLNWIRLVVSKEMKVRHGSNAYWLNIECDIDDIYCPPDEVLECWPGAEGLFDSGIIVDGGPTGSQLCDCDGKNCVTYIGPGPSGEGKGNSGLNSGGQLLATSAQGVLNGSKENPLPCPVTAYGGRAAITEFYVDVSQISGMVTLNARGITADVRVRVYKNCDLLADTNLATNATRNRIKSYLLKFLNDTSSGIGRVLVRVDAPSNSTLWGVALSCPNQDPDSTNIEPAPCYGTYHALIGCTAFAYERIHKLDGSGTTWLDITVGKEPIRVSVFYQGTMIASTGDYENGWITTSQQLVWNFAQRNSDDLITIRIECTKPTTEWTYSIYCPNTTGAFNNPDHCRGGGIPLRCEDLGKLYPPHFNRVSNGADITDTWFDLSGQIDGKVYIPFNFIGDQPIQLLVYQNGAVVAGVGPKLGTGRAIFMFKKALGTKIRVRVIGTCCPNWTFQVQCPLPVPEVCIDNPAPVVRPLSGQKTELCFTLRLDHVYDETVTVEYETWSPNSTGSSGTTSNDGYTPADFIPETGSIEFSPCETEKLLCIDIWGISRTGPSRQISVVLKSAKNATICNPGVGTGVIENHYVASCSSNTALVVKDGGDSGLGSGARLMYTQAVLGAANNGYTAVLDMKITFPAEGVYRFYAWGDDQADLYVECIHLLTHNLSSGTTIINPDGVSGLFWVPAGTIYMYLIYKNIGPRNRNPSSCAMKIMHPNGSVFYASNAADWRSRTLDEGTAPYCRQFPPMCSVNPTVAVIISPSMNDTNIGYPAQRIQSAAHAVNCAPGGTYYVMERKMTFPVSGIYTWRGTADDNFWFYMDCNLIGTGNNWNGVFGGTFYVEAGEHELTLMYQNVPNCTPGWAKLALLSPGGAPFYYSDAAGWLSLQGNLGALGSPMYAEGSGDPGARTIAQYGAVPIRAGWRPHYAWFTAELLWNCPANGNYRIVASADDNVQIFMDCASVVYTPSLNWATWSEYFFLPAGVTNIVARCFNQQSKRSNYFIFAILNEAGQVVYATNPTGWKARAGDIDWTGMLT